MPLLNLGNRRSQQANNDGEVGKLDYRIGNAIIGQGVYLTGAERSIPVDPPAYRYSVAAADKQISSTSGVLHSLTFSQIDAAPTAGTIIVYDSESEAGDVIFRWDPTTAVFIPFTVVLDVKFNSGLYIGFTTTADINVLAAYL